MIKRNYLPGTETTRRRPTPTDFAHLKKWIAAEELFINITNITELTNINQQLEQTAKLYVSNVISRVIAQIIGEYGDGFVTIKGTADGELKVKLTAADLAQLIAVELAAGTNLIGKVELSASTAEIGKLGAGSALIGKIQIAGTSLEVKTFPINVATGADHTLATPASGKKIQIRSFALTVGGDVGLTWCTGSTPISGIMAFGGTNEPRGMSHNFGDYPLETAVNGVLKLRVSAAIEVDGFIVYTEG